MLSSSPVQVYSINPFVLLLYFYHSCIITHILTAFIYFIIIFFNATARIQVRRFNKKPDVIFEEEETCIFSEGGGGSWVS